MPCPPFAHPGDKPPRRLRVPDRLLQGMANAAALALPMWLLILRACKVL